MFDNLNGAMSKYGTYDMNVYDDIVNPFMDFLEQFTAPVYTCSALADRWNVDSSFDACAQDVRDFAPVEGICGKDRGTLLVVSVVLSPPHRRWWEAPMASR